MRAGPSMDARPTDPGADCPQGPQNSIGKTPRRVSEVYIFVMVKVPDPEQPVPVMVHVPVIVLPSAVPFRVIALPAGVAEFTTNPKVPFTLPLVFPLSWNDPLSVSAEPKHVELLVKVKFEMLSELSPFTTSDVPKVKAITLFESTNVAFHVPLMLAGVELFEPQPTKVRPTASNSAAANCFMKIPQGFKF